MIKAHTKCSCKTARLIQPQHAYSAHVSLGEIRPVEACVVKDRFRKVGLAQISAGEVSAREVGVASIHAAQVSISQPRLLKGAVM